MTRRDMIGWDITIACMICLISIYCDINAIPMILAYLLGAFHVIALTK